MTVVSIYVPPNTQQCQEQLGDFLETLPRPVLVLGDFNAHHICWGSTKSTALGHFIAEKTLSERLLILNDGSHTRIDPATEAGTSQHPWIQQIENMLRGRPIKLCWIPGHAGIHGNEEADRLAGEARGNAPLQIAVPGADANNRMKTAIRNQWFRRWSASTEVKLREVKFDTGKWTDRENSAEQRVLTRLRIGHTRLTHDFLLKKTSPPVCDCCGIIVDVRHVILHCRKYDDVRRKHDIESTSLRAALRNDRKNEESMVKFLKETNLFNML
ncbi:uncharacterized protein LOC131696273 [Topomyia yanbarensis]|uniref:uncharacterized protein LOC131696273 n=1 Tax=Topomyia yanbarensis TaxID=2498891 RepID=UPI00273B9530|nr:uncharacterized protein LOC131696273 [Topomyia yanbarensis]